MTNERQYYESIARAAAGTAAGAGAYGRDEHAKDDYNNNILHGAGRVLTDEDKQMLRECYNDNIGEMTGAAAGVIERAFLAGIEVCDIIMAIEDTGLAPRPSGYYLKRILDRWIETGVTVSRARDTIRGNNSTKWWKGR